MDDCNRATGIGARSWTLLTDQGVVILGIPIPSSSPVFLSIVGVHVAAGLVCTVAGIVAMLSPKRAGRHPASGTVYYWSLVVVFLTMTALSILRWPHNTHLLVLGILSFGAGVVGRMARRRAWPGWLPVHITGMAVSYIFLLTAFYVDNGPHLPLWRSLPPAAYWVGPSLVGIPILVRALRKYTLTRRAAAPEPPLGAH
jgi:hypothetical protein